MRSLAWSLFALLLACGDTAVSTPSDGGFGTPCGNGFCEVGQYCHPVTERCQSCRPQCDGRVCGNDGCGGNCGECAAGKLCNSSIGACEACTPSCANRTCGDDGCGGSCGACQPGETCTAGACKTCVPETEAALCARLGKNCGSVSATDTCGAARTVSCGSCSGSQTCGGGGVANVCGTSGCVPESSAAMCLRLAKNCGSVSGTDNCGAPRTVSCGSCSGTQTCGGGGVPNVCGGGGCTSESNTQFCYRNGAACGSVTAADNCGISRTVSSCGNCPTNETCTNNSCVTSGGCTGENDQTFCQRLGKDCGGGVTGFDNCGNARTVSYCGTCGANQVCGGVTPNVCCAEETDAQLCTRLAKQCGSFTGKDNCGVTRTVDCGPCASPDWCGGGGTANQCGCSESNSAFCARLGAECGSKTANDVCGVSRTVACGTCPAGLSCGGYRPNVCYGWESVYANTGQNLFAIHGKAASDFYIGGYGTLLHSNGKTFANVTLPSDVVEVDAIFERSPTEVWVGGLSGKLYVLDGTATPRNRSPCGGTCRVSAIQGDSNGVTWVALGGDFNYALYRYSASGSSSPVTNPYLAYTDGLWVVSPTDVWAVGMYWPGGGSTAVASAEHGDGTTTGWTNTATTYGTTTSSDLLGVWGTSSTNVYAVGKPARILRWTGSAWTTDYNPNQTWGFLSVYGTAADDVFAVGEQGKIYRYGGSYWSSMSSPTTKNLNAVFAAGDQIWAVGAAGTVLHLRR